MSVILQYPQLNVGTIHARVTSIGPSLTSNGHSHEQSVIASILKRGYYHSQVNVGTLHARVAFVGLSLASKDHSHEQSVIPAILKRGYCCPQVNVGPCHHIQEYLASFILDLQFHPMINDSLIINPPF